MASWSSLGLISSLWQNIFAYHCGGEEKEVKVCVWGEGEGEGG